MFIRCVRRIKISIFKLVRDHYRGFSIVNGSFDFKSGQEVVASGMADLVPMEHYILPIQI